MKKEVWGKTSNGTEVYRFSVENKNGVEMVVSDFGATLVQVIVPDKNGNKVDVTLGYDDVVSYENNGNFFGCFVGPVANRIANAEATIDGVSYQLEDNDSGNNLHSDTQNGMNKRIWNAVSTDNSVTFTTSLKDMEYNLPGNREFSVTYTLTDNNEVKIEYLVKSDKNTIINLTNHSYFNLAGHDAGDVTGHQLQMDASSFTQIVKGAIPTGTLTPVKDTPLDFTEMKVIARDIETDYDQVQFVEGYDHNFVIDNYGTGIREFAKLYEESTGITMYTATDLPGVQLYTGNWVTDTPGKGGCTYKRRCGLCLETQHYPDSVHHDNFPSTIFGPDRPYESTTVYRFEA